VVGGVASGDGGRIGYVPWVPSASVACGSFVTRYPRLLRGQPLAETWHFETMGSDPVVSKKRLSETNHELAQSLASVSILSKKAIKVMLGNNDNGSPSLMSRYLLV